MFCYQLTGIPALVMFLASVFQVKHMLMDIEYVDTVRFSHTLRKCFSQLANVTIQPPLRGYPITPLTMEPWRNVLTKNSPLKISMYSISIIMLHDSWTLSSLYDKMLFTLQA